MQGGRDERKSGLLDMLNLAIIVCAKLLQLLWHKINPCEVRCTVPTSAGVNITMHNATWHWPWSIFTDLLHFRWCVVTCARVCVCVCDGNRDRDSYGWTRSQRIRELEIKGNKTFMCVHDQCDQGRMEVFPAGEQLINQSEELDSPQSSNSAEGTSLQLFLSLYSPTLPSPSLLHSARWDNDRLVR